MQSRGLFGGFTTNRNASPDRDFRCLWLGFLANADPFRPEAKIEWYGRGHGKPSQHGEQQASRQLGGCTHSPPQGFGIASGLAERPSGQPDPFPTLLVYGPTREILGHFRREGDVVSIQAGSVKMTPYHWRGSASV